MKKIFFAMAVLPLLLAACEKACDLHHMDEVDGYPIVLKGSFPENDIVMEIGEKLTIAPVLADTSGVSFEWYIGDRMVSDSCVFEMTFESVFRGNLSCNISNQLGTVTMDVDIATSQDFSKGYFIALKDELSFYDAEKGILCNDVLSSMNGGRKFITDEYTDIVSVLIENGIMAVCLKHNASNLDHLLIFDYPSLEFKTSSIVSTSLTFMESLGNSYAVTSDMYGLYRIDMVSGYPVCITSGGGYVESIFANSALWNDKVFFNVYDKDGADVRYADAALLRSAKEASVTEDSFMALDITQRARANFVVCGDKLCTVSHSDRNGSDADSLVSIGADLSVSGFPLNGRLATGQYWSSPTNRIASSADGNVYYQLENGDVCSIDAASGNTGVLISSGEYPELKNVMGGIFCQSMPSETGDLMVLYGVSDWSEEYGGVMVFGNDGNFKYRIDYEDRIPVQIIKG